jgi:hypothetical protein
VPRLRMWRVPHPLARGLTHASSVTSAGSGGAPYSATALAPWRVMPAPASSERAVWVPSSGLPYSVPIRLATVSSSVGPATSSSDQWASRLGVDGVASARVALGSATAASTATPAMRVWGNRGKFIVFPR